jgi:hypothetical protein
MINHQVKASSIKAILVLASLVLATWSSLAGAQNNYDDHQLKDRWRIHAGGLRTEDTNTTIRLDSSVGLGTFVELENKLNVESSVTVFRFDGHYRFNRAHRVEWSWYNIVRDGSATVEEELQIGDKIYEVGMSMDTQVKTNILKLNYAWSFINVERYEFFLGAGLNVSDTNFKFTGRGTSESVEYEDGAAIPLPTLAFGGRYNISDDVRILFRSENLSFDISGYEGRFKDSYIFLEYDFTEHFGIGGGLNSFHVSGSGDVNENLNGKFESSYRSFLLYLKYQR